MLVWNYLSLKACKITHFYIKCACDPEKVRIYPVKIKGNIGAILRSYLPVPSGSFDEIALRKGPLCCSHLMLLLLYATLYCIAVLR